MYKEQIHVLSNILVVLFSFQGAIKFIPSHTNILPQLTMLVNRSSVFVIRYTVLRNIHLFSAAR
jgi:hypothetical protein